jgi:hypothetical protein
MEVGRSSCSTEPDAPRKDKFGARWVNVEQARLAVFSRIACHRRRGSALPVVGAGGRPVRPTVLLAGLSLGGLQRRLGVLGPGLGRPAASPLGRRPPRSGPAGRPSRPRRPYRPRCAATLPAAARPPARHGRVPRSPTSAPLACSHPDPSGQRLPSILHGPSWAAARAGAAVANHAATDGSPCRSGCG